MHNPMYIGSQHSPVSVSAFLT